MKDGKHSYNYCENKYRSDDKTVGHAWKYVPIQNEGHDLSDIIFKIS